MEAKGWNRAGEHPLGCQSQERNSTFLMFCLWELVMVSSCWRDTLIWYLLCFGYTFYWVKIAAVRKISVNHKVMLTRWAKVRWEGQTEKWRQEGKRARRGAKCQRKLSFFNELDFLPCAQEGMLCFFLRRGVERHLLLPSASILIISVNTVDLLRL